MSNDKQQTAVDFLMDKLFDPSMMVDEQLKWFEQAKIIEKNQIIKGVDFGTNQWGGWGALNGEDYYEQTYRGNK